MWIAEFPDEDELAERQRGSGIIVALLIVIFLAVLTFFVLIASSALGVVVTIGFWPVVQPLLDSPLLRIALTLSLFTIGIGFYLFRKNKPRLFAAVEILFAFALAWVALGEPASNRLAIVLAFMASSFIFASAIQLWIQSRPVADNSPRISVGRNQIQVYRGGELLARLPTNLNGVAYKTDVNKLVDRIEQLEQRCSDSDGGIVT